MANAQSIPSLPDDEKRRVLAYIGDMCEELADMADKAGAQGLGRSLRDARQSVATPSGGDVDIQVDVPAGAQPRLQARI